MLTIPMNPTPLLPWWQSALIAPAMWWLMAVGLLCFLGLGLCFVALSRLPKLSLRSSFTRSTSGSATMEFMLIIPILLFCTLTLTQTTLVMGGRLFVHYAAFAAVRSAVVTLGQNVPDTGEERNRIALIDGWKLEHIRQAAVMALLPAAGRLDDTPTEQSDALVEGFGLYYESFGREAPPWIDNLLAQRFAYADRHTSVTLVRVTTNPDADLQWQELTDDETYLFGPREPITVRVKHQLNLSVAYVWRLFADHGDARQTEVHAHYTLMNHGISTELPARPTQPPDFYNPLERL